MKTQKISWPKTIGRKWHQVDVSKFAVGRVATHIANLLRGKHKRDFTPHLDMGDFVVAFNADKPKLSGRKVEQKKYFTHSGFLGGIKTRSLKELIQTDPAEVLKRAVYSMIDDVKFRKKMMGRLKLVKGTAHNFKTNKLIDHD